MSQDEIWSVKRLLEWTTDYLKKNGSESPRLESEILLAESLGWKRIELYTRFDSVPNDTQRTKFREFVKRRAKGEPVAYLVGHKEFYSLSFIVNQDVLIPRPETEHLVVESLDLLAKSSKTETLQICDVGTGSGAIAVSIAKHAPKCHVTAVDISTAALEIARKNAQKHGVTDRVTFVEGDLLDSFDENPQFDLIVSNPPYVGEAEYSGLAPDVMNFEPKLALVAPGDGTGIIFRLIEQASSRLNCRAFLLIEISPMIAGKVSDFLAKKDKIWTEIRILRDLAGHQRIVSARKC